MTWLIMFAMNRLSWMVVLRGGVSYMFIYQVNIAKIVCEDEGVMWIVFCG